MTEIASFSIRAKIVVFKFLTSFYFGFVMRVRAAVPLFAFAVDEFFAHAVCCKLRVIACGGGRSGDSSFIVTASLSIHVVVAIGSSVLFLLLFIMMPDVEIWVSH